MRGFARFLQRLTTPDPLPFTPPKIIDPLSIVVSGQTVILIVKPHQTARRMTLRMGKEPLTAVITIPKRVPRGEALAFAERSRPWIEKQLKSQEPKRHFAHGTVIPLWGENFTIVAEGQTRGVVSVDEDAKTILVPGQPHHVARRLTDFLKAQAERELSEASSRYAAAMGLRFTRLTVRDQKSRWGSCSETGALSYSWRLILAPRQVLDYVAAHEVAHLKEMNHGPRFWRLVLTHCPHARFAKQWLKANGRKVHSFG
jgi:predicted metal-dependent hydrolase